MSAGAVVQVRAVLRAEANQHDAPRPHLHGQRRRFLRQVLFAEQLAALQDVAVGVV
jgi:hypothetical protein